MFPRFIEIEGKNFASGSFNILIFGAIWPQMGEKTELQLVITFLIQTRLVYSGLVEIIFSYCYVLRSFEGDLEPESSTMIGRLAPTLSWLDTCATPRDALK